MSELVRANKITAYWQGEGVAVAVFYKTHTKLMEKCSNDADVVKAGFTFPEGTEESPVTAQDKLQAFKTFMQVNATAFGIEYDPVDRRAEEFKFPNKYDEDSFAEYAKKMAERSISECLAKVQKNVIENSYIKGGYVAEDAAVDFGVGNAEIAIKESYPNGSLKYADAKFPVTIAVGDNSIDTEIVINLVSGQLKKPREFADGTVLTQTGVKALLIDNGVIPKIEKPKKSEDADEEMPTADDAE